MCLVPCLPEWTGGVGRKRKTVLCPWDIVVDAECLACVDLGLGPFPKRQKLLSLVRL